MKAIHAVSSLLVATVFFGCKSTPPQSNSTAGSKVTFVVLCSEPSMSFEGTLVCDGRTNRVSGRGAGTFQAGGYDIVALFRKSDVAGSMSVNASDAAGNSNTATTATPAGWVRSEFHGQPVARHGATAL
jgi:hypothetical protein